MTGSTTCVGVAYLAQFEDEFWARAQEKAGSKISCVLEMDTADFATSFFLKLELEDPLAVILGW